MFSYNPHWFSSCTTPASSSQPLSARNGPRGQKQNNYQDKFAIPDNGPPVFDPTTLITPRSRTCRSNQTGNAWANGPQIEVFYDPTETMAFPPLHDNATKEPGSHLTNKAGYGNPVSYTTGGRSGSRAGRGGYGRARNVPHSFKVPYQIPTTQDTQDHPKPTADGEIQPDLPNQGALPAGNNQPIQSTQQLTAPDIATIVAKAVAASHAKLTAELQDTRDKFAQLEVEISNLHNIINTNAQQIAAATSQAAISALTGPESPFVTKEDSVCNQEQHIQTQVQLQSMQTSINDMLRAFLASRHHNPTDKDLENLKTPPPPRKLQCGEQDPPPLSEISADSSNTVASPEDMIVEGVGAN